MTTRLSLSLGFNPNPRSVPILDGTVEPEGIQFACSRVPPGELFHRQLTHREFDVSEMSISSLLMIMAKGDTNWVALPIFTTPHLPRPAGRGSPVLQEDGDLPLQPHGHPAPLDLRGEPVGRPQHFRGLREGEAALLRSDRGVDAAVDRNGRGRPRHPGGARYGHLPLRSRGKPNGGRDGDAVFNRAGTHTPRADAGGNLRPHAARLLGDLGS